MRTLLIGFTIILTGGLAVGSAQPKNAQPQSQPPPFTKAQLEAGSKVFAASCAGCHGKDLVSGRAPDLKGASFLKSWGGKPLAELHAYISRNMPLRAPGSLSEREYLNVVTYLLSENGLKPGDRALTGADLAKHTLSGPASTSPD